MHDLSYRTLVARLARTGWRPAQYPLGKLYGIHDHDPRRHVPAMLNNRGKIRCRATLAKLLHIHDVKEINAMPLPQGAWTLHENEEHGLHLIESSDDPIRARILAEHIAPTVAPIVRAALDLKELLSDALDHLETFYDDGGSDCGVVPEFVAQGQQLLISLEIPAPATYAVPHTTRLEALETLYAQCKRFLGPFEQALDEDTAIDGSEAVERLGQFWPEVKATRTRLESQSSTPSAGDEPPATH